MIRLDPLTQIPNRPALEAFARRLSRSAVPWVVALFDLDHFGVLNTRWTPAGGDGVLRAAWLDAGPRTLDPSMAPASAALYTAKPAWRNRPAWSAIAAPKGGES